MLVEPALHRLDVLMLPSGDAAFLAGCAAVPDGAGLTCAGPIAAQHPSIFLVGVVVGELFAGRAQQPATGRRYVRVRFYWDGHEQFDGQMTHDTWRFFLGLLKPSRRLVISEVQLTEWIRK
jgi:hypothetical protein